MPAQQKQVGSLAMGNGNRGLWFHALAKKSLVLMAAMILFLCLAGCQEHEAARIGMKAPGFSGTCINGEFISLGQFKGRVVILYFWSSSCCGDRLKTLEPLYQKTGSENLAIVAVNVGDSSEMVQAYAKRSGVTFTLQTDAYGVIAANYRVAGLPTIFLLGKDGIIREKIVGTVSAESLEKLVQRHLH